MPQRPLARLAGLATHSMQRQPRVRASAAAARTTGNDPGRLVGTLIRAREARENSENFEESGQILLEFSMYQAGTL